MIPLMCKSQTVECSCWMGKIESQFNVMKDESSPGGRNGWVAAQQCKINITKSEARDSSVQTVYPEYTRTQLPAPKIKLD